jgi:streptogramin lyase
MKNLFLPILLHSALLLRAQQWLPVPGRADDLSIGSDGSVWIVDTARTIGNIALWQDTAWLPMQAEGVPARRIAAGPAGKLWFVSATGSVYYLQDGRYVRALGNLSDIAAGADGSVYALGTDLQPGGRGVWRWTGAGWNAMGKGAVDLAVDADGQVWIVDDAGRIAMAPNGKNQFTDMPGEARAIAINGHHIWIILPDGMPAYWKGNAWEKKKCPGAARAMAVDTAGRPWIADMQGRIFRLKR